jgi:hypothetical protein
MYESIAVGLQKFADLQEIFVQVADSDMLHHPDRNYPVEPAGELAIIELAKLYQFGDARCLGGAARCFDLFRRDVYSGDVRAGFAREMDGETTPAGADLGDCHARLERQLVGGMDELVALRLL